MVFKKVLQFYSKNEIQNVQYFGLENDNISLCQSPLSVVISKIKQTLFYFASVIPYLSLFHVVVYGVSVRWYMQTNFSRYYFPLRYISPSLLFCLLLLSSLTISHIPAYYEIILFLSLTCGWPIVLKHITNLIEKLRLFQ